MPIITDNGFYMFDPSEMVENYQTISQKSSYINTQTFHATVYVPLQKEKTEEYLSSIAQPYEIFLPFLEYPERYYISNFGRVYSTHGRMFLSQSLNKKGYKKVSITIECSRTKGYLVHRMIMMTFSPRSDYQDMQVNHIDGNKTNNIYLPGNPKNNLEWCTNKENIQHALKLGLSKIRCEDSARTTRTNKEIEEICQILQDNPKITGRQVAEMTNNEYNCSFASLITGLRTRTIWKEIVQNYNIQSANSEFFNTETVETICLMLEENFTPKEILSALNLPLTESNYNRIKYIERGETFTNISSKYNIQYKNAFLSDEEVHQICKLLEQNKSTEEILSIMNLQNTRANREKIYHIKKGNYYSHITSHYNLEKPKRDMDEDIVRKICTMLENNVEITMILKELDWEDCHKNRDRIYAIKRKETYKNISKDYHF